MSIRTRKIILWSATIVLAVILLIWWVNTFQERLTNFQGEALIKSLNLPKIEMPQLPEINYGQ